MLVVTSFLSRNPFRECDSLRELGLVSGSLSASGVLAAFCARFCCFCLRITTNCLFKSEDCLDSRATESKSMSAELEAGCGVVSTCVSGGFQSGLGAVPNTEARQWEFEACD